MQNIPEAHIVHRTDRRLRIKVPSRKGMPYFFRALEEKCAADPAIARVQVNPAGGTALVVAHQPTAVLEDGIRETGLVELRPDPQHGDNVFFKVGAALKPADEKIKQWTGDRLDLSGVVFLVLLLIGVLELVRGKAKPPPWYTAFHYALGLFAMTQFGALANISQDAADGDARTRESNTI
jgi:hypothetical protein